MTNLKRPWCWERLKAGGQGDDRRWDGWMASPTQWTWVWVNSGNWWWRGKPGVLQSMGSQRVGHDWAIELNWQVSSIQDERESFECGLTQYYRKYIGGGGSPRWLSGKESASQCRRHRFHPWFRKIPWRRKWQCTPVFLPGKSHEQRSLVGYSPWGLRE